QHRLQVRRRPLHPVVSMASVRPWGVAAVGILLSYQGWHVATAFQWPLCGQGSLQLLDQIAITTARSRFQWPLSGQWCCLFAPSCQRAREEKFLWGRV